MPVLKIIRLIPKPHEEKSFSFKTIHNEENLDIDEDVEIDDLLENTEHTLPKQSRKRLFRTSEFVLWLSLSLFASVTGWILYQIEPEEWTRWIAYAPVNVHFALSVKDIQGHPIAGATVFLKEKKLGVTDAFGEWFEDLKFQPGTQVVFVIEKAFGALINKKEVMAHIPKDASLISNELNMQVAFDLEQEKAFVKAVPQEQKVAPVDIVKTLITAEDYSKIFIGISKQANLKTESELIHEGFLKDNLLPLVLKSLEQKGVMVDESAKWRVDLSYLSSTLKEGSQGAVLVSVQDPGLSSPVSFIRPLPVITKAGIGKTNNAKINDFVSGLILIMRSLSRRPYDLEKIEQNGFKLSLSGAQPFWFEEHDFAVTLEKELYSERNKIKLIVHNQNKNWIGHWLESDDAVAKGARIVYRDPFAGLKSLEVKFEALPSDAKVFVGGHEAQKIQQSNGAEVSSVWNFWGTLGKESYLTVVKDKKIVFRVLVIPSSNGLTIPKFILPY